MTSVLITGIGELVTNDPRLGDRTRLGLLTDAALVVPEQELRDCASAAPRQFTRQEIRAAKGRIGDVRTLIARGECEALAELYSRLGLKLRYDHRTRTVQVTADPAASVDNVCVRGGICTLTTQIRLDDSH